MPAEARRATAVNSLSINGPAARGAGIDASNRLRNTGAAPARRFGFPSPQGPRMHGAAAKFLNEIRQLGEVARHVRRLARGVLSTHPKGCVACV